VGSTVKLVAHETESLLEKIEAPDRRTVEGLGKCEIIRCLKRYIAREVFTALPRSQEAETAPRRDRFVE
jgi:hypothetical protein